MQMWDRPTSSHQRGRLLGTAVVWRSADPAVRPELVGMARQATPVVELLAVRVAQGRSADRYPFSALLYQSTMYERYKAAHFGRREVPTLMSELGDEGNDGCVTRQVFLWDSRYLTA